MCGITGFTWEDRALLKEMTDIVRYRGPDDHGYYTDSFVSLGHRRLSIIDLSKAGHQPMSDSEGNYIVFNGEIYNYKDLKNELQHKYRFKSNTDTEVLIHGYKEWGPELLLQKLNGMFAFAIWDDNKKLLFLARDRLGIKPLYYTAINKGLAFASEIKSLLVIPELKRELDVNAVNSYLTYRFIPSDKTVLKNIKKLLPGHYALIDLKKSNKHVKAGSGPDIRIRKYWDLVFDESRYTDKSEDFFIKNFQSLLTNCVKKHLMSDVPLGAFLSGGLDSSLIAAINTKLRPDRVKTFTVGFGHETDEFKYARRVAEHLNTDHHELLLEYNKITAELPKIVWYMDEPNSDITMFPLYFLSGFSRKHVTVVNTGEGADEIFSGYPHFRVGSGSFRFVPELIRRNVYSLYYSPFKSWDRKKLFSGSVSEDPSLKNYLSDKQPKSLLNRILLFDIKNELPNWQLARVDRMTMAHAQEARVPFLDHRMVEFSANLPAYLKLRSLDGKYLVKKAASSFLPREIITRKKQGFTTPRDAWFKDDFMDVAFALLSKDAIKNRGLFNYSYIQKLKENVKNKGDKPFRPYTYRLLVLALFEVWARTYIDNNSKVLKPDDLLC
jgi:asparagine synthase (glutamine-hydrolysing)